MEKLTKEDVEHLKFIYKRLENLHNENPLYDYMQKFQEIITKVSTIAEEDKYITQFKKHTKKLQKQLTELKNQLEDKL